jgi:Peptidase family S41
MRPPTINYTFLINKQMKITTLLLLITCKLFGQTAMPEQIFSIEQLQEDFKFIRSKMEKYNTNLYLYTDKTTLDNKFKDLYTGIDKPMTAPEFYCYISSIQPTVKDGHNYMLPSQELQNYYASNSLYFPIDFTEYKDRLFITQNFSNDNSINVKDEILSINGIKADSIYKLLENRHPRDGNNKLYAKYVTLTYFRSYYGFMFGFCKSFDLELKSPNGLTTNKTIEALPLSIIRSRRNAVINKRYDRINHEKGIEWTIDKERKFAYLFISHWTTKQMKKDYNLSFKKEFKMFFQDVKILGVENIIVDLRGNQGGNGENGIEFLKHIMNVPFKYINQVQKFNRKGVLVNASRPLTKVHQPYQNAFNGKVFVLVNEGSFSNSSIFSEAFKKYNRGKLIGTETGGCSTLSGGDGYFTCPNTRINLLKVTHRMITTKTHIKNGQGVIPDLIIEPTLEQILNNDDIVLKRTIEICSDK